MTEGRTFVNITNKDIYNEIRALIKKNSKEHEEIVEHQIETNGKVKLNRWVGSTALALVTAIIFHILTH